MAYHLGELTSFTKKSESDKGSLSAILLNTSQPNGLVAADFLLLSFVKLNIQLQVWRSKTVESTAFE